MKKSKKFVLAGLALLAAITMVLLPLSSCKTEVDTSSPQQEQTDDSTGTGENAGSGGNGDGTNTGTGDSSGGTGGNAGTGNNGSTGTGGNAGTGNNGSTDTSGNAGTGSDSNEDNKPEEPVVGTYTVKHLQQDASGDGYTPAADGSEEKAGTVGGDTEAEAKTYEGFTAQPVVQQKIAPGGATVVEIKYDRKTVTLQLDANGGSLADGGDTISGRYGADVEWSGNLTRSGHTFTGWSPDLPATFSLDDEGRTYTAQWQPNQVVVEATAPVNPAEGTITDSKTDSGYTFTADFGDNASGDYAWFVDGERQECTDKEFTWDTSSVAAGVHEIRVEFGGNDARTTVEVKK